MNIQTRSNSDEVLQKNTSGLRREVGFSVEQKFDEYIQHVIDKELLEMEFVINIILVFKQARYSCLFEYANVASYYTIDEFFTKFMQVLHEINVMYPDNHFSIYIETGEPYPRYLIFLKKNFSHIYSIISNPNYTKEYKTGRVLEMIKPGGDFGDNTKPRLGGRIVNEKYPGICLFAEIVPINNLFWDYFMLSNALLFRLMRYNNVLKKFNIKCQIELSF